MPDLLIRHLPDPLKRDIEERARANHRSLSDEAKELLRLALLQPVDNRKLGTEMMNLIRPEDRGDDLVFEFPGELSEPPDLT